MIEPYVFPIIYFICLIAIGIFIDRYFEADISPLIIIVLCFILVFGALAYDAGKKEVESKLCEVETLQKVNKKVLATCAE